jgi:hypothetical protein
MTLLEGRYGVYEEVRVHECDSRIQRCACRDRDSRRTAREDKVWQTPRRLQGSPCFRCQEIR